MAKNKNLYALLEAQFSAAGDAPAFVVPGGRTVTYKALSDNVGRMANALTKLGVKPGDRVMAQVEKSIENVTLYLATLKAGAVFSPLNTAYMPAELEYFIDDAEPSVLVMPMERLAKLEDTAAVKKVPARLTLEADGSGSMLDLAEQQPAAHETATRAADDLACLLYTSGTTGRSKGAMLTHENLSSNAQVLHATWQFRRGDVLLHALPIFHTHGLFVALHTAFLNASKIHWLTRFDLDAVMKLLPQSTVMMGVPTFYTRLLGTPAFTKEHCSKMRLFISGSPERLVTHCQVSSSGSRQTPVRSFRRATLVCSRCAALTCSKATGAIRRRPRKSFATTASSSPAISRRSMRTVA
jgi:malonyl-CoA/methylmalonyl-CoA synthetase